MCERKDLPRVGVYICHCGGNISDHVDVEALRVRVKSLPGVTIARDHSFMCSDPGQELILKDLQEGKIDRVVIASCSPSLHEATFRSVLVQAGVNPYLYEHANIREQVSWVHHGEAATRKAFSLIAAATEKARLLEPLEPIRIEATAHATVIGGGVAGMRAALDLANQGIAVALIEKTPFLGGRVASLDHLAPAGESAPDLILRLARSIASHPLISVYTCARVIGFDGYVGNFSLTVEITPPADLAGYCAPGKDLNKLSECVTSVPSKGVLIGKISREHSLEKIKTGAIILATGFKPYTPYKGEYGYGEFPEVITLPQLIEILRNGCGCGSTLFLSGRPIRSMVIIHCVGSRQIPGVHDEGERGYLNEYCSRVCCSASLNAALRIRERYPGTKVFELYRDIRTYGRWQEDLYRNASHNKVVFIRFEPEDPPVVERPSDVSPMPLVVRVKDTLTFGEEVSIPADLVVLAVGMEPNDINDLINLMKLPVGSDRFLLEVHPKLRPVELRTEGIFLAGTCQAPMDVGESCNAASAAASKAAILLGKGYVELDPFVAEVDPEKCEGTGACVEACLRKGAIELVEEERDGRIVRKARVIPALCLGCGACVAVCPTGAIQVRGATLYQYEAMVDAIVSSDAV
ncbi:MAG: CoB--CoM heterodisulfide reductase iron-sulfur subunit A family protein [Thermodesulforhabdaceae bacterium]